MYAVAEGVLGIANPMVDPLAYDATIERPEVLFSVIPTIGEQWRTLAK